MLTPSSLHIVKTILPNALKLMMLSRGNYAFDLFLQLTHVMQVYLFTVLCMFSTCHPSSYDEESRRRLERFNQQFKSLFGEVDLKKELMSDGVNVL